MASSRSRTPVEPPAPAPTPRRRAAPVTRWHPDDIKAVAAAVAAMAAAAAMAPSREAETEGVADCAAPEDGLGAQIERLHAFQIALAVALNKLEDRAAPILRRDDDDDDRVAAQTATTPGPHFGAPHVEDLRSVTDGLYSIVHRVRYITDRLAV
jgi:hypothetical protein